MEKGKIQFKPLHEGMGFHPFSDGLPYAPESKSKLSSTGAGATAAGRPRFTTQSAPVARTAMKTARQMQQPLPIQSQPIQTPVHQPLQPRIMRAGAPLQQPISKPIPMPQKAAPLATDSSVLRKRAFAYLLDSVIHSGFWIGTNLAALLLFKFQFDADILKDHVGQFAVFFFISQWIFIALQEVLFENSIGKSFFNLEFKRNHGSLFLRSIVFMIGLCFFGLGLRYRLQDRLGEIQMKQKLYSP